jgi:hypothetical protein
MPAAIDYRADTASIPNATATSDVAANPGDRLSSVRNPTGRAMYSRPQALANAGVRAGGRSLRHLPDNVAAQARHRETAPFWVGLPSYQY